MWWVDVFQTKSVIDALLWLLLTDLKRPCFIADSIEFGKEWIGHCVQQQAVVDEAGKLCVNVFTKK